MQGCATLPDQAILPKIPSMPRKFLTTLLLGTVFILIAGYAIFQARNIVRGAEISLTSPKDELVVATSTISITGIALRAAHITLDDNPIFTDPAGNFSEETILTPGMNIIKIQAEDRYKRQKTELLHIYYYAPTLSDIPLPLTAGSSSTSSSPANRAQ